MGGNILNFGRAFAFKILIKYIAWRMSMGIKFGVVLRGFRGAMKVGTVASVSNVPRRF